MCQARAGRLLAAYPEPGKAVGLFQLARDTLRLGLGGQADHSYPEQ